MLMTQSNRLEFFPFVIGSLFVVVVVVVAATAIVGAAAVVVVDA
jgi:hypothetical protein